MLGAVTDSRPGFALCMFDARGAKSSACQAQKAVVRKLTVFAFSSVSWRNCSRPAGQRHPRAVRG